MSKTILITGTSSGFGKLTALALAGEGNSVIAAMREPKGKNAAVRGELEAVANIEVVDMDVTSEKSVNDAVASVLAKYGHIDVLINNAGVAGFGLIEATSVDLIKKIFEVNLFGAIRTYQAVLPAMRKERAGLVINITSGLGLFATPFMVPYEMTKFSLEALTEGIRHEIKGFGIETITVLPGPFPTEIGGKSVAFAPDRNEVLESYGAESETALENFGAAMFGKIAEYKADASEVATAIVGLVNMKTGTRPYHTVVNRIGEGVEQAFADSKAAYKTSLMNNLGWGAY